MRANKPHPWKHLDRKWGSHGPRRWDCQLGRPGRRPDVLNGNAGRKNKLSQLLAMTNAGVQTLSAFERPPLQQEVYPLIARRFHHVAGRDIRVCLQPEDAVVAYQNGSNFFTRFIPRAREYRVWIFRKRHLGSYEKVLARPERYTKFGCNYHNGWTFRLVNEASIPRDAVTLAGNAVAALGLDFGAVDILVGKDGTNYVLEVNSAPGVAGEDRQVIRALARKIANWDRNGFLRRNGATDAQ